MLRRSFVRNVETYKMLTRLKPPKTASEMTTQMVKSLLICPL